MSMSVGVDTSYNPPRLTINGTRIEWHEVQHLPKHTRKVLREKLAGMNEKYVVWTMPGCKSPGE